jgi:hypothetical protein
MTWETCLQSLHSMTQNCGWLLGPSAFPSPSEVCSSLWLALSRSQGFAYGSVCFPDSFTAISHPSNQSSPHPCHHLTSGLPLSATSRGLGLALRTPPSNAHETIEYSLPCTMRSTYLMAPLILILISSCTSSLIPLGTSECHSPTSVSFNGIGLALPPVGFGPCVPELTQDALYSCKEENHTIQVGFDLNSSRHDSPVHVSKSDREYETGWTAPLQGSTIVHRPVTQLPRQFMSSRKSATSPAPRTTQSQSPTPESFVTSSLIVSVSILFLNTLFSSDSQKRK